MPNRPTLSERVAVLEVMIPEIHNTVTKVHDKLYENGFFAESKEVKKKVDEMYDVHDSVKDHIKEDLSRRKSRDVWIKATAGGVIFLLVEAIMRFI